MDSELFTMDRDTGLAFASMLVGAGAWIGTEHLFTGIAVGIAMHAVIVISYESFARSFGWKQLEITRFAQPYLQRHLKAILLRTKMRNA